MGKFELNSTDCGYIEPFRRIRELKLFEKIQSVDEIMKALEQISVLYYRQHVFGIIYLLLPTEKL